MVTDPISDLLTRIRNAQAARHEKTTAPHSKLKAAILEVLKKNEYINDFKVEKEGVFSQLIITLNPDRRKMSLKRVSRPGQRIYIKRDQIKPVLNGYGIALVSTSKGVMTTAEARRGQLGGELLCEIS